jgi:hypothetical protein
VLDHPELLAAAISKLPDDPTQRFFIECDFTQQPIAEEIEQTIHHTVHWSAGRVTSQEARPLPPGAILYIAPDAEPKDREVIGPLAAGLRAAGIVDLEGPIVGAPSLIASANAKITMTIGAKK